MDIRLKDNLNTYNDFKLLCQKLEKLIMKYLFQYF